MAEVRSDPPGAPAAEPERTAQTIEPAAERGRARSGPRERRTEGDELADGRGFSAERGNIPEALKRRYFHEAGRSSVTFFAGPGAKVPAFRDHGDRLVTHQLDPTVIRDMVAIAAHRGWRAIQVRGDDDFRREVWMEARALGLEVRGYRPRQRDAQELAARLDAEDSHTASRRSSGRAGDGRGARAEPSAPRPAELDAGVRGVLVEIGEAPFRRRPGEPPSPFVRLEQADGRRIDIWGAGLPEALARSGAKVGDPVRVRRDGVERVQRSTGGRVADDDEGRRSTPGVDRTRWTILADRFREASPAEAARDPDLRAALSQLTIAETVVRSRLPDDQAGQDRVVDAARARVAMRLGEGRQFRPAQVHDAVRAHDRGDDQAGDPKPPRGPERARRR